MNIDRIDHIVLTVRDVSLSCDFYSKVMGMEIVSFGPGRKALAFGSQKINLHLAGAEIEPHANKPTPGSADLCFISSTPLKDLVEHLRRSGVSVLEGPVKRTGALGPIESIYFRDPDLNLIEVSNYL